jgi:hypothetical protein
MIIDTTPFTDFNLFFAWYINVIKGKVDGYNIMMSSDEIHLKVGRLTKEEAAFTEKMIRRIQRIPKGIVINNDNSAGTFYCRWNNTLKKAEICYPSVTYYWLRFPNMVKAAFQHEIGHIINGDILFKSEFGVAYQNAHAACINRSQDTRINQNLNYQTLDYINRCLFTFSNSPTSLLVPETFFIKCGLPLSLKGKSSWQFIHTNYHNYNPNPLNEDAENYNLKIGQYVQTTISKHGKPAGTYGITASAMMLATGGVAYTIAEISQQEIDALNDDDYKFFEEFTPDISTMPVIGDYQYDVGVQELEPLKKPVLELKPAPQTGDIAILIKPLGVLGEATFAMVSEVIDIAQGQYKLIEFTDEIQGYLGAGNADKYFELLEQGVNLFTSNEEIAIYLQDFITKQFSPTPPQGSPPPPPEDTKQVEKPQAGDVVVIEKGVSRGKYGIIKGEDNGEYIIDEVSEAVARAVLSKK